MRTIALLAGLAFLAVGIAVGILRACYLHELESWQ